MKKYKVLKFDEVMDIYDEISQKRREVRAAHVLKSITPKTVANGIKETISLSENLIWKKRLKR